MLRSGLGCQTRAYTARKSGLKPTGDDTLRAENVRLKAELKRALEERDILKKAAAYFAKVSG